LEFKPLLERGLLADLDPRPLSARLTALPASILFVTGHAPLRPAPWRFGVFEVDPVAGELRKQGRKVRLPDQSVQILLALLERPGEMVTRQQLQERLWHQDTFVDFDANLNTAVSLLRDALGDSAKNPRFIETLPRRGYRFLAEVKAAGAEPPPAPRTRPGGRRSAAIVAGLVVLVAVALSYLALGPRRQTVDSVAVLPLVYAGPQADGDHEYLADGLTSALITELARLGVPNVISETSVMRYKGAKKPLPTIARELGADVLVEGSVVREGNVVRVNAQLIDARSDKHIWARSYQQEMRSVLELQDEIARAIVMEIRSTLAPVAQAPPAVVNPAALEAYLRGRHALREMVEDRRGRAPGYFEEALRLEPTFAPAYAGLAEYYGLTDAVPPGEALPRARAYAHKALELDRTLAGPHLTLAMISLWGDWAWAAAEREFQRSLELDPGDAATRRWYALFLDLMARPRAAAVQLQRMRELDPVSALTLHAQSFHLFLARRYDEALTQMRAARELSPHDSMVFDGLGNLYIYAGDYQRAVAAIEEGIALWGRDPASLSALATAHARAGRPAAARTLLDELDGLARQRHVPASWFAGIHVSLGEIDRAVEWLETGFRARDAYLVQLQVNPAYDPIRGDARYHDLVRRMKFPNPESF
jgi:TolB-like protein/DNA-binding winged helix-turn-helix (wHTH) protein/tetratricopeptide (TPR) repeat protein